MVLVSVKTHHTASAAELLRDRLAPGTTVVTLQNGLTFDVLSAAVGPENLLVCFVNFGADYLSPGVIMQGNVGTFRIGELDGSSTERLRRIADALPYAVADRQHPGLPVGQGGLRRDAVRRAPCPTCRSPIRWNGRSTGR